MRNISLKQLRTFSAAVRSGSLSAAARQLNITPPAVTLQMQLLEEALGMPIAERTSAGWRPTDAGRELLMAADRIQAALDDCERGIGLLKGIRSGRIAVSIVSTAKYFAPLLLAEFIKQFPDVELALTVGNREDVIENLRRFQADVAIMGRPPTEFDLDTAVIGDNPHVVIARPDHPRLREMSIPRNVLNGEVFLMREEGSGTRILADKFLTESKVTPRIVMEMGSNETIKQAVMAGLGISIISANTIVAEVASKRMGVLPVEGTPILREWFVVKRQERRLMPAPQKLWEFMVGDGRKLMQNLSSVKAQGNGAETARNGAGGQPISM